MIPSAAEDASQKRHRSSFKATLDSLFPEVNTIFGQNGWSVVRYEASITGQKVNGRVTNEIKIHFSSSLFELTLDQTLRKATPMGQKVKSKRVKTGPTELPVILANMISGSTLSPES